MRELVEEHIFARKTVGRLLEANRKHLGGDKNSITDVISCLRELSELYPQHIEKEDKHFFFLILDYFTAEEQAAMLKEFWEFDKNMIHEKYRKVVEEFSKT
jgi:hemerythrin-like domain-containing protein